MSEVVTIGGTYPATIYGTFAGAIAYIQTQLGDQYTTFIGLSPDDQKRALAAAARFIDRQVWVTDYDTFAKRDAATAFQSASYELGALAADDPSVLALTDQGTNIQAVNAGGAGVTFFNPTSSRQGTAPKLPPILMDLVGAYLASRAGGPQGGSSQSSCATNPFSPCSELERKDPW